MGLTSSLYIGQTAITTSQIGLQVTGNNMANATTPGYTRQTALLAPLRGQRLNAGTFVGRGVGLSDIVRHVDEALQARIRSSLSDEQSYSVRQQLLSQIETLQGELSEYDLSSALDSYFEIWSEMANDPTDQAVRTLVVQQGITLSDHIQNLLSEYTNIRDEIDNSLGLEVEKADELLSQIATLNGAIVNAEQGSGTAGSLRDQRDELLDELSGIMDIRVIEQASGTVDVLVGSTPVLLGTQSRGLELHRETDGDQLIATVRVVADGSRLNIRSGEIGAYLTAREEVVDGSIEDLNQIASSLIYEVNRLHSQGQGTQYYEMIEGTYAVEDTAEALNSAEANLPFEIVNGHFMLQATQQSTGSREAYRIDIDLDGIGTDTSLEDLVDQINTTIADGTITAFITADSRLKLEAVDGYEISFSDDTSGALAALGVNTYFTGESALDIAVNTNLITNSQYLAVGSDHIEGSNGNALSISGLREENIDSLDGVTFNQFWADQVGQLAVKLDTASRDHATATAVREGLQAQESAISGVSLDEESINLMKNQQQYQAAARFISVIDGLMDELLNIL